MGFKKIIAATMTVGMMMSFIPASVMAAKPGWDKTEENDWRYYISADEYVVNDWRYIGGSWYYFDGDGFMLEDTWEKLDGKLYHFGKSGAMDKNKWIDCGAFDWIEDVEYVDSDWVGEYKGKRLWRYVGSDGAAFTGWKKIKGAWYYFEEDEYYEEELGLMYYCWHWDKNLKAYYNFDGNGKYRKNTWYKWEGDWYYFGSDGLACTGWNKINKKWYYFEPGEANMWTGIREIGGKYYYLASSGEMRTGWIGYTTLGNTKQWYYAGSDGALYQNQWLKSNGIWYFFDDTKLMASSTTLEINGLLYDFDASGKCTNPIGRKIT
ncbi:Glucan-binding domain-containing protein (YG repeat) [Ruminococcaceae bacterium YRB3002]|nr:Glucan-binding domain-containing protein (YG repeat) [Ruminococcaceae bacterium YRB3002]